nr:MAG TPA: hypothetical protein [Caudoviricetes sp.]
MHFMDFFRYFLTFFITPVKPVENSQYYTV